MYNYGIVSRGSHIIIFGGRCDGSNDAASTSKIVKYDNNNEWTLVGNLQADRSAHQAISIDDRIYVVGGHKRTFPYDRILISI